jgi:hypothetical protein
MRVVKATLKNVLGIRSFELDAAGKINVISGTNGSGKTSVLTGLRTLIGGGNLATLKNNDATEDEQAEGVLVLDGDDGRVIITKTGKSLDVRKQVGDSAAFEKVPAPQRYLDALFDAPAANPVAFLTAANDKERIQRLLEALPLEHDPAEMWAAIGIDPVADKLPPIPRLPHPLQFIAEVREAIFTTRTGINTTERDKRATVEQIRRDIPAEQPAAESADAKQAQLDALREQIATDRQTAQAETRRLKAEAAAIVTHREETLRNELSAYDAELKSEFQTEKSKIDAEIAELRAETERKVAALIETANARKSDWEYALGARRDEHAKIITETRVEASAKIAAADAQLEAATAEIDTLAVQAEVIAGEIATIREQQKNAAAIQALRDQADKQEAQADSLKAVSERFTAALKALEIYKANLTKDLPIKGLDISGGEFKLDGIKWEHINKAKKVRTAVQVSCLRFKTDFRPVFVDEAENLDSETFAHLETELEAAGAQAFIAMVSDNPLTVSGRE